MKVIDSSLYVDSVRYYLTMPKDIGFDYMESLVEEISDAEEITWKLFLMKWWMLSP